MIDAKTPHDEFWWYKSKKRYAVRKENWKLLINPRDPTNKYPLTERDSVYLVNLMEDPEEANNLAYDMPDKVEELKAVYASWYQRTLEKIDLKQ